MTNERAIEELKKLNDSRCVGCRQICRDHPNEMCSAYQAIMHAIAALENSVEKTVTIDGHKCEIIDEWEYETEKYTIGRPSDVFGGYHVLVDSRHREHPGTYVFAAGQGDLNRILNERAMFYPGRPEAQKAFFEALEVKDIQSLATEINARYEYAAEHGIDYERME